MSLYNILNNKILITGFMGWFIAQFLKTLIDFWNNKHFSLERLWGSGGMPSSHSSTVVSVSTISAIIYGLDSFEFAISFVLALIVMHDAMGVRRETGKQAKLLNQIMDMDIFAFENPQEFEKKLKEFVGHTPIQVLAGAILGLIIGIISGFIH